MALRIEKIWGTMFGTGAVRRKERDSQDSASDQHGQNPQGQEQDAESEKQKKRAADREVMEKAMQDLRQTDQFKSNQLQIELCHVQNGLAVRVSTASGAVLKIMSAEEFLKLRDNTLGDSASRGKILDQKF